MKTVKNTLSPLPFPDAAAFAPEAREIVANGDRLNATGVVTLPNGLMAGCFEWDAATNLHVEIG